MPPRAFSYIGGGHQFTRPEGKPVRFGNGVEFWSGAHDCLVEGCCLWEIYDAALTNQSSGTNVQENITYRRNVIWNNCWFQAKGPLLFWQNEKVGADRFVAFQQQHGFGRHSLVADPHFVDPVHHDFRLAPESSARHLRLPNGPVGALP